MLSIVMTFYSSHPWHLPVLPAFLLTDADLLLMVRANQPPWLIVVLCYSGTFDALCSPFYGLQNIICIVAAKVFQLDSDVHTAP